MISTRTVVITKNYIEGYHYYPEAGGNIKFLSHRHRHIFHVRCEFDVSDLDRQVEIFTMQGKIAEYFEKTYGVPAEFKDMSCEMIADAVLKQLKGCVRVAVLEDGEGGARVRAE